MEVSSQTDNYLIEQLVEARIAARMPKTVENGAQIDTEIIVRDSGKTIYGPKEYLFRYHCATQTEWTGNNVFHKATQAPDHEYVKEGINKVEFIPAATKPMYMPSYVGCSLYGYQNRASVQPALPSGMSVTPGGTLVVNQADNDAGSVCGDDDVAMETSATADRKRDYQAMVDRSVSPDSASGPVKVQVTAASAGLLPEMPAPGYAPPPQPPTITRYSAQTPQVYPAAVSNAFTFPPQYPAVAQTTQMQSQPHIGPQLPPGYALPDAQQLPAANDEADSEKAKISERPAHYERGPMLYSVSNETKDPTTVTSQSAPLVSMARMVPGYYGVPMQQYGMYNMGFAQPRYVQHMGQWFQQY